MKLNIYEKRKIVKTYEADAYDLPFGVIEDVADVINLDALETGSNAELIKVAGNVVLKCKNTVKDLMKDIFEGITDEELKKTKVTDVAQVLIEVVKYTAEQLSKGLNRKN
ncbi:MAG: hypothetical protein II553_00930 [Lachnospiraceae bacterium]|nr:hypothetical protein [Lachnospiraceae bacterium]